MNFRECICAAKAGDNKAYLELLNMYYPLIMKASIIEGEFDEDLFQEQCIVLINCIALFEL